MGLLDQLNSEYMTARKEKNQVKANLLGTLISEARMIGKNDGNRETTDDEVLTLVKKFLKANEEAVAALEKSGRDSNQEKEEKVILEGYLPQQLTTEELEKAIAEIVSGLAEKSPKAMGQVMAELKSAFPNRFDGKAASEISRRLLA